MRGAHDVVHSMTTACIGDRQRAQMLVMPVARLAPCALYRHIGDTTMRLGKVRYRSVRGEKSWLVMSGPSRREERMFRNPGTGNKQLYR